MEKPELATLPAALPESVEVSGNPGDMRWTPNEMRALKEASGQTMTELMGESAELEDQMQAVVWLKLYQAGHRPSWDQAGDVGIQYREAAGPDPTNESG